MIILSWNIEHLRFEKVTRDNTRNWSTFRNVVAQSEIAFLYEGKRETTAGEIAAKLNDDEAVEAKWTGASFWSTDEYVVCLYDTDVIANVKMMTGPTAQVGAVSGGERLPPVLDITPNGGGAAVRVAPWHGYGPAKTSTQDIFPKLTSKLAEQGVQLFFGDFNIQRGGVTRHTGPEKRKADQGGAAKQAAVAAEEEDTPRRSGRIAQKVDLKELECAGGLRTSTQSELGPTNRSGPLDRCMRLPSFEASLYQLDPTDIPNHLELTNHSPLFIFTEDDNDPDVIKQTLEAVKGYESPALKARKKVKAKRKAK